MSPTGAGRTSQGCIRSAVYRHLVSVTGSLHFHPQNCDPSLIAVSVRSVTPRNIPIQPNAPVPGSPRDPWWRLGIGMCKHFH
jgi:hypothetical protein